MRELNETLEIRIAARTTELVESRARLRHAADFAKLTYFDLDYAANRIEYRRKFRKHHGLRDFGANDGEDFRFDRRRDAAGAYCAGRP